MKKLIFYITLLLSSFPVLTYAQDALPTVYVPLGQNVHFVSPEPIQYVDISSKHLSGDLPLKNVLRIRLKDSTAKFKDAVITIIGEKFIAQYHLAAGNANATVQVDIRPEDTHPLDISGIGFSQNQLRLMAMRIFAEKPRDKMAKVKAFGLTGVLNHVYSAGDYLFLDISYKNTTRLKYDIEDIRFSIDDKKVTKASNLQSLELKPELTLFTVSSFDKYYRNIFVIRKLTFPGDKLLQAELSEKQLSGRILQLKISYRDILDADTLPN